MSPQALVGVSLPETESTQEWIRHLAAGLENARVVEADPAAPFPVDVLVVGNPPGETLHRFGHVRFIQSTWAGVDRLTQGAPPVPIARMVAPELTRLMTEFVLAAVLLVHRGFPHYRRQQVQRDWSPLPAVAAGERVVGVLGYGELGRPAATSLVAAGFHVVAWARSSRSAAVEVLAGPEGLGWVLARSDIVVNLLPLTPDTRGILDRQAFQAMRAGAALVNTSRGAHLVESDLLEALDSGRVSDAVLDVFEEEPLPSEHPFWVHDRVTVLPHVAAPSRPADIAPHVVANIRRFLSGDTPRFLVGAGSGAV